MKHPCKKCIVNAACSKHCDKYKLYISRMAELATFIGMILSASIVGPTLIYLSAKIETGNEWAQLVVVFMWLISFFISTILQAPLDEEYELGFSSMILFAPFIAICLIVFHIIKPHVKRA